MKAHFVLIIAGISCYIVPLIKTRIIFLLLLPREQPWSNGFISMFHETFKGQQASVSYNHIFKKTKRILASEKQHYVKNYFYYYFTLHFYFMYFVLFFYYDQVGFVSGIKSRSILEKKPSDVIWSNEVGEKRTMNISGRIYLHLSHIYTNLVPILVESFFILAQEHGFNS